MTEKFNLYWNLKPFSYALSASFLKILLEFSSLEENLITFKPDILSKNKAFNLPYNFLTLKYMFDN